MIEWHGWATISATAGDEDLLPPDAERRSEQAVPALVADRVKSPNETFDLRHENGALHLWLSGCHNRAAGGTDVLAFYGDVAAAAPGSYGVLYLRDDEANYADWWRYVMRRGEVLAERDESLSPHIGKVEDPWTGAP